MLILFDFKCDDCNHIQEELHRSSARHTECKACGGLTTRMISPIRSQLEGVSGHFPDAADKWARQHEKAGRQEPKR